MVIAVCHSITQILSISNHSEKLTFIIIYDYNISSFIIYQPVHGVNRKDTKYKHCLVLVLLVITLL